jgi:hypothetical protein
LAPKPNKIVEADTSEVRWWPDTGPVTLRLQGRRIVEAQTLDDASGEPNEEQFHWSAS